MYRIHQIKLDLGESKDKIPEKILKKVGVRDLPIKEWKIVKESIDARDKSNIKLVYSVDFETDRRLKLEKAPQIRYEMPEVLPKAKSARRPAVIGFGPAGIFASLILAQAGLRPIIVERGKDVERRTSDVESFWQGGTLDPESNVQFGEGGAGAFSDGKLTTGIKDVRIKKVIGELIRFGAPAEIAYRQKPHVGTDILRVVVRNIREEILKLGGQIFFETKVKDLLLSGGTLKELKGLVCETGDGEVKEILCDHAVLAPGHSARDTFSMLKERKIAMEQKPFSIGVRIEHSQDMIDISQYGRPHEELGLPPAEYKLSYRCRGERRCREAVSESKLAAGRGVYTFCMCPGGQVINASSEEGGVVVNGMSLHARDSGAANSALLCDVRTEDFGSSDVLAGVEFQRQYERRAYEAAGSRQVPPATSWGLLRDGKASDVSHVCLNLQ
ncbi:MAG: NAD(P)/FAD-dependent oxidoreductase [Anaerovoracaceae bacterium]